MPWYSGPTLLEVLETVEDPAVIREPAAALRCGMLTVRTLISAASPARSPP